MIRVTGLNCCAIQEISGIEDVNDPKKTLLEVCFHVWPDKRLRDSFGGKAKPSAFYLLSGVVGFKEGEEEDEYSGLGAVNDLSSMIRKNDLGVLKAGPVRFNRRNEPNHKIKVYLWAPSAEKLWDWFQANKGNHKPQSDPNACTCAECQDN